jgi:hypothetical protein
MFPLTRRLNFTLAGLGDRGFGSTAAPPPPAAVPPVAPVTGAPSSSSAGGGRATQANVRNKGGARGLDVMGTTTRALKSLTGQ